MQASSPTFQANPPSPILLKSSPHSPVSSALKAEVWTVPSSSMSIFGPPSLATASTASSFDVGHTLAVCPRPLHRLHSFSVRLAILWRFLAHLQHPRTGHYFRRIWRCCHCHRQPWPSHHHPCWSLYRPVVAFPSVRIFLSRGVCRREVPGSVPPPRWGMHPSLQPSLTSLADPSLDQPQLVLQFLRVQSLRNCVNFHHVKSSLVQQWLCLVRALLQQGSLAQQWVLPLLGCPLQQ